MGIGDLPKDYNRLIHGPYFAGRYYGKPDTPFGEVKISELPAWISRRSFNPADWFSAGSRAYHRWLLNWVYPRKAGMACIYQFAFVACTFSYIINYRKHWDEMRCKYH